MKKTATFCLISFVTILSIFFSFEAVLAVEQPISIFEVEDKSDTTVLANGDAKVKEVMTMSATAFISFRQKYPVLSSFMRMFKPANMPSQIEDMDLKLDEGKNQVIAQYTIKGVAVNKGDRWEIDYFATESNQKVSLEAQHDNVLVFSAIGEVTQGIREVTTITATLPDKASDIKFDSDAKKITYKLAGGAMVKGNWVFLALVGIFVVMGISFYFLPKIRKITGKQSGINTAR